MQDKENQEDQFHTDRDVQGDSQENRDTEDNPVSDPDRDGSLETTAIYTTLDSTEQTPEEHQADQSKDPRKEESTITDTPSRDETGGYHDEGLAMGDGEGTA